MRHMATVYKFKKQIDMYKKKLIQKLQQLVDKLPPCIKREHVMQDLIDLKLSKTDYHFITLKDKYKDEE